MPDFLCRQVGDVLLALCLTNIAWMPFFREEGRGVRTAVYGLQVERSWDFYMMIYVLLYAVGGLIEEVARAYGVFFENLELYSKLIMLLRAQLSLVMGGVRLLEQTGEVALNTARGAGSNTKIDSIDIGTPVKLLQAQLSTTITLALRAVVTPRLWSQYLSSGAIDGFLRALCLVIWFAALRYDEDDYNIAQPTVIHGESLLSFTVILLWLRSLQTLEVFQTTGPLVVMLGSIFKDVVCSCCRTRKSTVHRSC